MTIQVLPSDAPPHAGQMGSYSLLSFEEQADLDAVHVESLTSALYVEEAEHVRVYRDAFERLRAAALSPELSARRIAEMRDQTE